MGMYKDLRLNLAQCVCTGYMWSWILSSTYKIMTSWYHVPYSLKECPLLQDRNNFKLKVLQNVWKSN